MVCDASVLEAKGNFGKYPSRILSRCSATDRGTPVMSAGCHANIYKTGSLYPKTYWELLPKEILGAITQRDTESYYPKRYWELLPKEILGAITQRDTGSYYPKRYWELLPKEILGAITQRDTGSYYPKRYWEETDIQEKDKKKAKNDKTEHGMEKTNRSQSQSKSKVNQVKKIQLEGLKLPNLKLYYKG
ncbi:hypothetical protein Tco_0450858 [Tanacetum coccineum]